MSKFSKEAAKKSVLKSTLEHPFTLYSIGIGILATLASFLFGGGWLFRTIALGGFGIGILSWIVNYTLRRDAFAREYFKKLQQSIERKNKKLMQKVKLILSSQKILSTSGALGEQGSEQYEKIQEKFETLNNILADKLNSGEITYRRFLGMAEQVYFSVLDNLQDIATILKSASSIDTKYIEKRLKYLDSKAQLEEADKKEIETLKNRLELRNDHFRKVNELLTKNEEAMTKLDKTSGNLARVQTTRGRASMDLQETLKELEELANQAEKYSVTKKG